MNVLREDDKTIHLPVKDCRYPFDVIDYPWPLCGITGEDATYKFVNDENECEKCKRVFDRKKRFRKGQIGFVI